MKFAIASEHRDFFSKNGYIEFDALLTSEQLDKLNQDIKQALVNRLKLINHSSLERYSADDLYVHGRDLWRTIPAIKKIVCNASLAEIAWEFCQERPLRIGYDQWLPAQKKEWPGIPNKPGPYQHLLTATDTIASLSCIQGVTSALVICLTGKAEEEPSGIFPTTPGHGIYLAVEHPVDFSLMSKECDYLLITYAIRKSVYVLNQNDPLCHDFKQWGYTFSDALTDKLNPIILR